MLKKAGEILNKLKFRYQLSSAGLYQKIEVYKRYYGFKAGKNIRVTGNISFGSEPYLIELGSDITITQNVTFHTHDGGVWIFRKEYPGINIYRRIKIGNNVFIGAGSSIMPGVTVGDNVVIAAGSVVTKDCEPNWVYGGVPAKKIRSVEDYKEKVLKEAVFIESSDPEKRKEEILSKISSETK